MCNNNAVSRTAGLLSVAVRGIVMLQAFNHQLDRRLSRLEIKQADKHSLDNQRAKLAGAQVPENLEAMTRVKLQSAINESFVSGFRLAAIIAAGLALLSAASARLLIEGKKYLLPDEVRLRRA